MGKNLISKGTALAGNLEAEDDVTAGDDVVATDDLTGEDVIVSDDATVGDDLVVADQATAADLNATDDLAVADDAIITDDLSAGSLKAGTGDKVDKILIGTVVVDPAEIAAGAKGTTAVTVTGVVAGDIVTVNPPAALEAGLIPAGAYVSGPDEVTIVLFNPTGAPVDGASRTWGYMATSEEA